MPDFLNQAFLSAKSGMLFYRLCLIALIETCSLKRAELLASRLVAGKPGVVWSITAIFLEREIVSNDLIALCKGQMQKSVRSGEVESMLYCLLWLQKLGVSTVEIRDYLSMYDLSDLNYEVGYSFLKKIKSMDLERFLENFQGKDYESQIYSSIRLVLAEKEADEKKILECFEKNSCPELVKIIKVDLIFRDYGEVKLEKHIDHLLAEIKSDPEKFDPAYVQDVLFAVYRFNFQHKCKETVDFIIRNMPNGIDGFNKELLNNDPLGAHIALENDYNRMLRILQDVEYIPWQRAARYKEVWLLGKLRPLNNQVLHGFVLNEIEYESEELTVNCFCDSRIIGTYRQSFKKISFIPVEVAKLDECLELPASKKIVFGEAANLDRVSRACYYPFSFLEGKEWGNEESGWLEPVPDLQEKWRKRLIKNKKLVAVSFGSGVSSLERNNYMFLPDIFSKIRDIEAYAFVCLDYDPSAENLRNGLLDLGFEVEVPDLDLFNDLDDVIAILSICNMCFCTPNNIMDMASSLNIKTYVIDNLWQMKAWEKEDSGNYIFSGNTTFLRPENRYPHTRMNEELAFRVSEIL